ncbi:MAG: hypothetical protein WBN63_09310, partial [Eudoraea sp.]
NMVNGAGLAMATMDCIKYAGGNPVNFLDVGGGASAEQIENGFRILQSDANVKAILINIFGGILRCDRLANGVVQAAEKVGLRVPVIIRMEGTNLKEGRKILADSGLALINAKDLKDAAEKFQGAIQKPTPLMRLRKKRRDQGLRIPRNEAYFLYAAVTRDEA